LQFALEPLLRLHLCRFGALADLENTLAWTERRAETLLDIGEEVAGEFAAGKHILQDDAHFRALLFSALWSLGLTLRDWARTAQAEIERWDDLAGDERSRARAIAAMQKAVKARRQRE
jgi:hypothetical protein